MRARRIAAIALLDDVVPYATRFADSSTIHAHLQSRRILYWRDKRGHEIDFVWQPRGQAPIAIECKWSAEDFDPAGLRAFRVQYPSGDNYVVVRDAARTLRRRFGELTVAVVPLAALIRALPA